MKKNNNENREDEKCKDMEYFHIDIQAIKKLHKFDETATTITRTAMEAMTIINLIGRVTVLLIPDMKDEKEKERTVAFFYMYIKKLAPLIANILELDKNEKEGVKKLNIWLEVLQEMLASELSDPKKLLMSRFENE
jgi:hypothetical protein